MAARCRSKYSIERYWRRSKMKNAATDATMIASTASLPLLMDCSVSRGPRVSAGARPALRESRAVHHALVVRRVRGGSVGPAVEEALHPARVVVIDAQRIHVHA